MNLAVSEDQAIKILVARLRDCANGVGSFKTTLGDYGLCDEAASVISALQSQVDYIRTCRDECVEGAAKDRAERDALRDALHRVVGSWFGWHAPKHDDWANARAVLSSEEQPSVCEQREQAAPATDEQSLLNTSEVDEKR